MSKLQHWLWSEESPPVLAACALANPNLRSHAMMGPEDTTGLAGKAYCEAGACSSRCCLSSHGQLPLPSISEICRGNKCGHYVSMQQPSHIHHHAIRIEAPLDDVTTAQTPGQCSSSCNMLLQPESSAVTLAQMHSALTSGTVPDSKLLHS